MRDARQVFWGIITALISIALVFGIFALSLAEGNMRLPAATPLPTFSLTQTPLQQSTITRPLVITLTWQPTASLVDSATPLPPTGTPTPSPTPSPTHTIRPANMYIQTPIPCGKPRTWVIYIIQQGDTLYHLGQAYGIPYTDIQTANCLANFNLRTGQQLYVPPWATRTPSPTFPIMTDPPLVPWTETPTWTINSETGTPTNSESATDIPLPTTETPVIIP
jgi:hypothetical protein